MQGIFASDAMSTDSNFIIWRRSTTGKQ